MDQHYVYEDGVYTLPYIDTRTKIGKINRWQIYVLDDSYYTISQLLPTGKAKRSKCTRCLPKNVGKRNETTGHTQALLEAYSKWEHKKRIVQTCMLAQTCTNDTDLPISFGASPKLDGIRAIAYYAQDQVYIVSRKGLPFSGLNHIKQSLVHLLQNTSYILDGELYNHDIGFNELSGIVRSTSTSRDHLIEYWVFDLVSDDPYHRRVSQLRQLISPAYPIQLVTYELCTRESIDEMHDTYVKNGYEGLIVRMLDAPYEQGVRSRFLLKYKKFKDEEFRITAFKEGVGSDHGAIIFQCESEGKLFYVRPTGTLEQRRAMYLCGDTYIGKQLTVRYQCLNDQLVPRFPVGVAVRDYE